MSRKSVHSLSCHFLPESTSFPPTQAVNGCCRNPHFVGGDQDKFKIYQLLRDRERTEQGTLANTSVACHLHLLPDPALSLPSTSVQKDRANLCPHINNQDVPGLSSRLHLCCTDRVWRALPLNRVLKGQILSGAPQWALLWVCACSLVFVGVSVRF